MGRLLAPERVLSQVISVFSRHYFLRLLLPARVLAEACGAA
jgi:hypothetical protein